MCVIKIYLRESILKTYGPGEHALDKTSLVPYLWIQGKEWTFL